jgi:hypothetical protein
MRGEMKRRETGGGRRLEFLAEDGSETMQVFISWSGPVSRGIAEKLSKWLPSVIQAVKPYFSPDIKKGVRWRDDLSGALDKTDFGIVCLTRENLSAPWLLFESGAIAKKVGSSKLCPIMFGVEPSDVDDPLAQFQCTKFESPEMRRLVFAINHELGERRLSEEALNASFDKWWPDLEAVVSGELKRVPKQEVRPSKDQKEILETVLEGVRTTLRLVQDLKVGSLDKQRLRPDVPIPAIGFGRNTDFLATVEWLKKKGMSFTPYAPAHDIDTDDFKQTMRRLIREARLGR